MIRTPPQHNTTNPPGQFSVAPATSGCGVRTLSDYLNQADDWWGLHHIKTPQRPPHQQRVLDERAEVHTRLVALLKFMPSETYSALPHGERSLLLRQAGAMCDYRDILDQRIALWAWADPC